MSKKDVLVYDIHGFEKNVYQDLFEKFKITYDWVEVKLNAKSAILAKDYRSVCSFVNDKIDKNCLLELKNNNVELIALRSAGFNHVDLKAAKELELTVCRVPGYSPNAIAEFSVALLMTLNRKIHRAYHRVRELNFSLDGLVGFDLNGKTVGVIGTGKIGKIFSQIVSAFGCHVLMYDLNEDPELLRLKNSKYTTLEELYKESDIISLHVPLNEKTFHMLNSNSIQKMKSGVYIINTGRGGLIDTKALIEGLKSKKIAGAALDVYEEEENIFFQDLSNQILTDDLLARLLTFPQVLITSHQAFLTQEALKNISETTVNSLLTWKQNKTIDSSRIVVG